MMDQETIIKGLEIERECVSRDCDRDCGKCDLAQDRDWLLSVYDGALELLKEQEAVEPVLMREGRNEYYNDYVCPECDNELVFGQNFCSECGRPVKW